MCSRIPVSHSIEITSLVSFLCLYFPPPLSLPVSWLFCMIQYPSSLDWLESLFNIEEEKPETSIGDVPPARTRSCMSTAAANSGVQTSSANSPSAQSCVIPADSSSSSTTTSSILDIDPNLLNLLLQITDKDICVPMNSNEQRLEPLSVHDEDAVALDRMKADAARDFNEWKHTKRLIKRLSRHDSAISCCSPPTKKAAGCSSSSRTK